LFSERSLKKEKEINEEEVNASKINSPIGKFAERAKNVGINLTQSNNLMIYCVVCYAVLPFHHTFKTDRQSHTAKYSIVHTVMQEIMLFYLLHAFASCPHISTIPWD